MRALWVCPREWRIALYRRSSSSQLFCVSDFRCCWSCRMLLLSCPGWYCTISCVFNVAEVAECSFSPVPDNTVPRLLCFRFQMSKWQNVASLLSHPGDWFNAKDNTVETFLWFWFEMLLKLQNAASFVSRMILYHVTMSSVFLISDVAEVAECGLSWSPVPPGWLV